MRKQGRKAKRQGARTVKRFGKRRRKQARRVRKTMPSVS